MVQRSFDAWKSWKDAQIKYDYYIVGLVAALFAYVGSNYEPEKLAFSDNTLELVSIMFLIISLIAGIKRLEADLVIQTITLKQCEAKEMRDIANKIIEFGGSKDRDSGEDITVEDAKVRTRKVNSAIEELDMAFNYKSTTSKWLFNIRNWSLTLAFMSLTTSKLLGVYNAYT